MTRCAIASVRLGGILGGFLLFPIAALLALAGARDGLLDHQHWAKLINLEAAWKSNYGSHEIIVAVPDTGVFLKHVDLKKRLWRNPGEIAGNKIDDDANGFVDDIHGWNFVDNNNDLHDTHPRLGHGTSIAGIIAAEVGNGRGISGISPHAKIMVLKTCDSVGDCATSAHARAVQYAVKNGARIINASWGHHSLQPAMKHVINWAFKHGVLLITGSGNDGKDLDGTSTFYPTSFRSDSMLSVASINHSSRLNSFSNTGQTSVHLAAPGYRVLSTTSDGGWEERIGTSFAAPMVSGVGAMVLSIEPTLSARALRNALLNAVTVKDFYSAHLATSGALDALKAVTQLSNGFQVWPAQITLRPGDTFEFTAYKSMGNVQWSVSDSRVAQIDQQGTLKIFRSGRSGDTGSITITAVDESGKKASTQIRVVKPSPTRKGS